MPARDAALPPDTLADALADVYSFLLRRQAERKKETPVAVTFAGQAATGAVQADHGEVSHGSA